MNTDYTAFPEPADAGMNSSLAGQRALADQMPMVRLSLDKNPWRPQTDQPVQDLAGFYFARNPLGFCGRRSELWRLYDFTRTPTVIRWWAVTGPSGSGKKALAYEFLRRLTPEYYGFFLECGADLSCAKDFVPFQNTLVVIDSMDGHEDGVARYLSVLMDLFEGSVYFLRILFLERENPVYPDSWYDRLENAFDPEHKSMFRGFEYDPGLSTLRGHNFLCLGDMDDLLMTDLVEAVCRKKGLLPDPQRNLKIREAFAEWYSRFRYSPLFLQLFVEAYVENRCGQGDWQKLLKEAVSREAEKLRTGAAGPEPGPDICQIVRKSILEDMYDNGQPPYPDMVWMSFYLYYMSDAQRKALDARMRQSHPKAYCRFLTRCVRDFPGQETVLEYVRGAAAGVACSYTGAGEDKGMAADSATGNVTSGAGAAAMEAVTARLALVSGELPRAGNISQEDKELLEEEYGFWKDFQGSGEAMVLARLYGLYHCSWRLMAWNLDSQAQECLELLHQAPDSDLVTPKKIGFLLDHGARYTDEADDYKASRQILQWVEPLFHLLPDGGEKTALLLRWYREQAMIQIIQGQWHSARKLHEEVFALVDWTDEYQVELYAYWGFSCTMRARLALEPEKALDFGGFLMTLGDDYGAQKREIAFSERALYYYLHSRYIITDFVMVSAYLTDQESCGLRSLKQFLDLAGANVVNGDLAGLLVGAWAMQAEFDMDLTEDQVLEYFQDTEGYLEQFPGRPILAEHAIHLWNAGHDVALDEDVPEDKVEKAYALLLGHVDNPRILDSFFQLLRNSTQEKNWSRYTENPQVRASLFRHGRSHFLKSPVVDEYYLDEPYVRPQKKVYPNDPCPCGSGKKYKKCCGKNG